MIKWAAIVGVALLVMADGVALAAPTSQPNTLGPAELAAALMETYCLNGQVARADVGIRDGGPYALTTVAAPPGMTVRDPGKVWRAPAAAGAVYLYASPTRVVRCGVAVYGVRPGPTRSALVEILHEGRTPLTTQDGSFYKLIERDPSASYAYFGEPRAPGLDGVWLTSRRGGGADAPAVEADYHLILVQ